MHTERIVLHIDMDAFFAAIEERDKPRLRGRPIVVGADPAGGKGRGVVSTANYKGREYGIHSAEPISEAWRRSEEAVRKGLPPAVFIGGNHRRYSEVSHAIMEYLRTEGSAFEQASIDEAYLQLEFSISNLQFSNTAWEAAEKKAREIKSRIKKKFGLTCSIGIGPNKLIAKIAAGMEKPDGLTIVRPERVQAFLDPQPTRILPGVGPKTEQELLRLRLYTVHDVRQKSEDELKKVFGKWGASLYRKAHGVDESPITEAYETKSIGEQETFETDTRDAPFLVARLKALSDSVSERLMREGFEGKTVAITVRFGDFETLTRAHTAGEYIRNSSVIAAEALRLFLPFLDSRENPRRKSFRLLGVRVEKLRIKPSLPGRLFDVNK